MYVKLDSEMVYLWRAVDRESEILESYVTNPALDWELTPECIGNMCPG